MGRIGTGHSQGDPLSVLIFCHPSVYIHPHFTKLSSLKELPLIHTSWLKPFADYFATRRIDLTSYYELAQIEAKQVTTGDGWVTKHQLYLFLNSLAQGEKMPEVGFVVGETITPDCLGELGEAMAAQETLGGVVRSFCELINRHVEGNRCWLEEGLDGEVWLLNAKTDLLEVDRAIADHAGLMSMVNLARLVGGKFWYPKKAHLQTKATDVFRKIPALRDCQFEFGQPAAGFAFPSNWLLHPTKEAPISSRALPQSLGLLQEEVPLTDKIKLLLREILGVGGICPTIKLMSDLCDTSPRTLHRQLKSAEITYQGLLDEVRYERACEQLSQTEISIKELALNLGYSGTNNFSRAFHRIAGVAPSAFRIQQRR
jgi:AraC-like DNA-binding protein